jgi:calcineurin-like phosphoesterase
VANVAIGGSKRSEKRDSNGKTTHLTAANIKLIQAGTGFAADIGIVQKQKGVR